MIASRRSAPAGVMIRTVLHVEVWSDVVCPWCYIGKRRFEQALARFEHRDLVSVSWRSFELDPHAPRERDADPAGTLAVRHGIERTEAEAMRARVASVAAGEGLHYLPDAGGIVNSFDAHRLTHLAAAHGQQAEVVERLFAIHFLEGGWIADSAVLVGAATSVGIDAEEAEAMLEGRALSLQVAEDERLASRLGARGVPFFVAGRSFSVSGAQPAETLLGMLRQGWDDAEAGASAAAEL